MVISSAFGALRCHENASLNVTFSPLSLNNRWLHLKLPVAMAIPGPYTSAPLNRNIMRVCIFEASVNIQSKKQTISIYVFKICVRDAVEVMCKMCMFNHQWCQCRIRGTFSQGHTDELELDVIFCSQDQTKVVLIYIFLAGTKEGHLLQSSSPLHLTEQGYAGRLTWSQLKSPPAWALISSHSRCRKFKNLSAGNV